MAKAKQVKTLPVEPLLLRAEQAAIERTSWALLHRAYEPAEGENECATDKG